MVKTSGLLIAAAVAVTSLSACAAGGGGSGGDAVAVTAPPPSAPPTPPPATATAFTTWSAVAPPYRVTLTGIGLDVETSNVAGGGPSTRRFGPPATSTPSLTLAATGDGTPQALRFASGPKGIDLQAGRLGERVFCCAQLFDGTPKTWFVPGGAAADFDTANIFYAPAIAEGWNYQTFGAWVIDTPITSGGPRDGFVGGFSVGAATPAAAVPASGAAMFSGKVIAWTSIGGLVNEAASTMQLSVDFGARSAVFNSAELLAEFRLPGTAMSGVLTYSSGQNAMSGTLATANGALSGPVTGQFYGPGAEEVGGAFALAPTSGIGNGNDAIVGGFGARR